MSWGYFLDLDLELPIDAWPELKKISPATQPIAPGWWAFEDAELESSFSDASGDDITVAKALGWFTDGDGSVCQIATTGGVTRLRLCTLIDRGGDMFIAKPFAALFDAAVSRGGNGSIKLVNDGTYSGEEGVSVTLDGGELARARIADHRPLAAALGAAIYGTEIFEDDEPAKAQKPAKAKPRKAPAKPKKPPAKAKPKAKAKSKPKSTKKPARRK